MPSNQPYPSTKSLSFFLALVFFFIVIFGIPLLPNELRYPCYTLLLCLGFFYIHFIYRLDNYKRLILIDDLLEKTKVSILPADAYIALKIYQGTPLKTLKTEFKDFKKVGIYSDLFFRAKKNAHPSFLQKNYYLKQSISNISWPVIYIILSGVCAHYTIYDNGSIIIRFFIFITIFIALEYFFLQAWIHFGYPPPLTFAYKNTWKNKGSNSTYRSFIILYLINYIFIKYKLPPLQKDQLKILYSNDYKVNFHPPRSETILAINHKKEVVLHQFTKDPREPYFRTECPTLNDFFKTYLTQRITSFRKTEVYRYPLIFDSDVKWNRAMAQKTNDRTIKFSDHFNRVKEYEQKHYVFYNKAVSRYMHSPLFLLLRCFL